MNIELKEFNHISCEIDHLYHEAALKLGMTGSELDMFYVIAVHGDQCNQSLLYKETGMRKSTVNTSIRKLEKEGVLYLKAGEGRNTKVCLTDKGRGYLTRVAKVIDIENQIIRSWTPEEKKIFVELNRRYADQFRSALENL